MTTRILNPDEAQHYPRFLGNLHALAWVAKKEWLYFVRYPTWFIGLVIWPFIFPLAYILSARALSGPDGSGLALFTSRTGNHRLHRLYRRGHHDLDVAKCSAMGGGFCAAQRTDARHA